MSVVVESAFSRYRGTFSTDCRMGGQRGFKLPRGGRPQACVYRVLKRKNGTPVLVD